MALPALFQDNQLPGATLPAGPGLETIADQAPLSASVTLNLQPQVVSNWCWCAVAVSITLFYRPDSTWTQCRLATQVLDNAPDCCDNQNLNTPGCNNTADINEALTATNALAREEDHIVPDGPTVYQELSGNRPVACEMNWNGTTENHYVVIVGYRQVNGEERVDIADPLYPPSTGVLLDDFLSAYSPVSSGTTASWVATYYTKKPTGIANGPGS